MLNEVVLTRFGFAELAHPTRKRVGTLPLGFAKKNKKSHLKSAIFLFLVETRGFEPLAF